MGVAHHFERSRLRREAHSMDAPSLDGILRMYGLERRHLQLACPRDIKLRIAERISNWKMIGTLLGFDRIRLYAIDRENHTEDERKVALFDAWSERDGNEATCLKLAEVLLSNQRRDLVEVLSCELVKIKETNTMPIPERLSATPVDSIPRPPAELGEFFKFWSQE